MAHSPRYEARLDAAWRDLYATVDALQLELLVAWPRARRKALSEILRNGPQVPPKIPTLGGETMRYRILIVVTILGLGLSASPAAGAAPIYLDASKTRYYDFHFWVGSFVIVVPGRTGLIPVALRNSGTEVVVFQRWDVLKPWLWDIPDRGLRLGARHTGATFSVTYGAGIFDQFPPSNADFLNNLTLPPGERVTFDLPAVLPPTVMPGEKKTLDVTIKIAVGEPVFTIWESDRYVVNIVAGTAFELGPFEEVPLCHYAIIPTAVTGELKRWLTTQPGEQDRGCTPGGRYRGMPRFP